MNPTLSLILQNLIALVVLVLTPVAVALAHQLLKKWKLDHVDGVEDKVDGYIETAMAAAEKASLNAVKAGRPATPGEAKLASAITFVTDQVKSNKLPEQSAAAITAKIDAKLFNANGVTTGGAK